MSSNRRPILLRGTTASCENAAKRDAFYASELFQAWEAEIAHMVEGETRYEHISGFEGWLTLPGETAVVPPPRWKTTALTLLGVYPWPLILLPYIGAWPLPVRSFIIAAAIVLTLGYGLMPFLTRWLHPWLHAGEKKA